MKLDRNRTREKSAVVLSAEEEVTLRRVAYGQSEVRVMRAVDLERLRRLRLIEDGKDGPRLTIAGKQIFDALPRGVFVGAPRHSDYFSRPPDDDGENRR
jgi:hypothetical protein